MNDSPRGAFPTWFGFHRRNWQLTQSSCSDKSCLEVVSLLSLEASRQMPHGMVLGSRGKSRASESEVLVLTLPYPCRGLGELLPLATWGCPQ